MKLKGWVVFFFFAAFLVLEGCSLYDYNEYTISLDKADVHSVYWQLDDSTEYKASVCSDVGNEPDFFSIKIGFENKDSIGVNQEKSWIDTLFVAIYGCTDYGCEKAEKIMIHNEDYSFTRLLKKGDFEISEPEGKFYTNDFGYDCDVVKEYFFHLKIKLDDVKLDLDAQKGSEACYERSNPWCIYC